MAALKAAYDAQLKQSCTDATAADLGESDETAAAEQDQAYDPSWQRYLGFDKWKADLRYCVTQSRETRRSSDCAGAPPIELLNRAPDQFTGKCSTITFIITQFDQATGACAFRARFDATSHDYNFEFVGENSVVSYPEPCPQLNSIGVDDVVRIRVVDAGGFEYATSIGGTATAVRFTPIGDPEILKNA